MNVRRGLPRRSRSIAVLGFGRKRVFDLIYFCRSFVLLETETEFT
jgi:hypothetical protein